MMQTDVYNVSITSTGVLLANRQRIRQITFVGNATAGSITIYDNASAASGRVDEYKFSYMQMFLAQLIFQAKAFFAITATYGRELNTERSRSKCSPYGIEDTNVATKKKTPSLAVGRGEELSVSERGWTYC
jgi:hypothetical protein